MAREGARVVATAVERYGRVDILVNMAGKVHWRSVLDMDLAAWNEAVLSFPTAGMPTTKHAARAMIAAGNGGSVIHLLSTFRSTAVFASNISAWRSGDFTGAGISDYACAIERTEYGEGRGPLVPDSLSLQEEQDHDG